MKTILITGNDTEIGKTWVTRSLALQLLLQSHSVQVVKPVETGVSSGCMGVDVRFVVGNNYSERFTHHTLYSFEAPLAPVCAAKNVSCQVTMVDIIRKVKELPSADYRLVESAGGLAVPIDEQDNDFLDLANELSADYIIVVVQNRLGAINQSRLVAHYLKTRTQIPCAFWLNETYPQNNRIKDSNFSALKRLSYPLWYSQEFSEVKICFDLDQLH